MSISAIAWAFRVQGITPGQKIVLLALADYSNSDNQSWPSQETLSEKTCQSVRTVRECLASLESAGLIRRDARSCLDGRKADVCTLLIPCNRRNLPVAQPAKISPPQPAKSAGSNRRNLPVASIDPYTVRSEPSDIRPKRHEKPTLEQWMDEARATHPDWYYRRARYAWEWYEGNSWKQASGKLIKNWKLALAGWYQRDLEKGRTGPTQAEIAMDNQSKGQEQFLRFIELNQESMARIDAAERLGNV